jgi:putative transposase
LPVDALDDTNGPRAARTLRPPRRRLGRRRPWPAGCQGEGVSLQRQVLKGQTKLITRNCIGRQFLLRPEPQVERVFLFVLAYAAWLFGVSVHAIVVLSTHYHLILTDEKGLLPRFMERVDSLIARALNQHHGRQGALFEPGSYSEVLLETQDDVARETAYLLLNPVKALCVASPDEWPGLITPAAKIGGGETVRATKPEGFFRREGAPAEDGFDQAADDHRPRGRKECEIADAYDLEWTLPPQFGSQAELQAALAAACRERMAEIRQEWKEEGVPTPPRFRGAKACRADSIRKVASSKRKQFQLDPRRMGRARDWTRSTTATRTPQREEFWKAHREAMRQWVDGYHDVVFPAGTWWMHRFHGARRWGLNEQIQAGTPCRQTRDLDFHRRQRAAQRERERQQRTQRERGRRSPGGGGPLRGSPSAGV